MSNVPKHYAGEKDVIDHIQNKRGMDAAIDFCFDNVFKYATRMTRKGQLREDVGKIEIYTGRVIDIIVKWNPMYKELVDEAVRVETITDTVKYLHGQFGLEFVLDYIQGRIIELASSRNGFTKHEEKIQYDIYVSVLTITLTSCYINYLDLFYQEERLDEECLDEEDEVDESNEEETIVDPFIDAVTESVELAANEIANVFKDMFKRK